MARSLTRLYIQFYLIFMLILAAAGYAVYLAISDIHQSSYNENVSQTARTAANRINVLLAQQHGMLEKIAQQEIVVSALRRDTTAERERYEDRIKSMLVGATAARLLPRDSTGTITTSEKLAPGSRDYLQSVLSTNAVIPSEFYDIGTPSEHYDLAVPVRVENKNVAGFLLASFTRAPLQEIIEQSLPRGARMELQQSIKGETTQTVLTVGNATNPDAVTVATQLGQTNWTLLYQPANAPPTIHSLMMSGGRVYYLYFILFAALITLIVFFRFYRWTVLSIRHDIKSLTRMFKDVREGGVRVDYPMELKEFTEIFDYFRDRGQKLIEEQQKLKDMGLMDHLSKLGNRRHFETRLKELFDSSKANGPSSVLIIDVDHFKAVNDKHGHDAGDALIVGFANALRKVVRQTDVLSRLGGDEFCIIYTYAGLDKATVFADRLRKQLPREIPLTKGVIHQIRWTGGLSTMTDKDSKPDDVLWRADQALLRAKESGRNNTKIYDPNSGPPAKKQIMVS